MDKGKVRREASVPAQSRVDIRTLAQLTQYWFDTGVHVKSVSQLISWSLESMVEVLRINGKTGEKPTIEKAEEFMSTLGLMQRGMQRKKLLIAKTSESLSMEGSSLQSYAPGEYKAIHSNKTWTQDGAEEAVSKLTRSKVDEDMLKKAIKLRAELEAQMKLDEKDEIAKEIADVMANADVSVCPTTGAKIVTPKGVAKGVVTEKDMEAFKRREKGRDRLNDISKTEKVLDRREQRLLDEMYLLNQEEQDEDSTGRREGSSEGLEGKGDDFGGDI